MVDARYTMRHAMEFTIALTLSTANSWVLTDDIFPLVTAMNIFARDVCTLVQAIVLLLLAVVALRRPHLLRRGMFTVVPIVCAIIGSGVIVLGLQGSPVLCTVGLSVAMISPVAFNVLLGCSLVDLDFKQIGVCVLIALLASYVLRIPLSYIPQGCWVFVFFALTLAIATVLVAGMGVKVIDAAREDESPSELAATNPFSFLPLGHQVFVCLFLFRVAYGYALSYEEMDSLPPLTACAGIAILSVFLIYYLIRRRLPKSDVLFYAAVLLVVAGFLFAPTAQTIGFALTGSLLEAGSSCFMLMFWLAMGILAKKNSRGALFLFAWSGFLLAIGVIVGAYLGRVGNGLLVANGTAAIIFTNCLILGYIGYTMVVLNLKGFSFTATINGLEESPQVVIDDGDDMERYDRIVMRIADERGMTPREAEIFKMLAHGRTGTFIEDELTVSYNTVKTHVAHIYDKLGIHNHQELIDYVELRCGKPEP